MFLYSVEWPWLSCIWSLLTVIHYSLFCAIADGMNMNINALKVEAATLTALGKPQGDEEAEGFPRLPLKMARFCELFN